MSARDIGLQMAQVFAVLALSPLIQGIILQFEERVQRGQGPGIFQPYRDLWKLFHKSLVVPRTASWVYWVAPVVAFTCMMTVPILIPVLTNFPLPLSDMGDILGGGLILTLGSFMILLAGLESGDRIRNPTDRIQRRPVHSQIRDLRILSPDFPVARFPQISGYDLRKLPQTGRYEYGFLPPRFFRRVRGGAAARADSARAHAWLRMTWAPCGCESVSLSTRCFRHAAGARR